MSASPTGPVAPGPAVEVATWRPVEEVDLGGWRAGLSGGFTRRANSVVPAEHPEDVEATLERVEALYAGRGLPARFRVCGAARPDDLDARLAVRGYRLAATTHVMVRALDDLPDGPAVAGTTVGAASEPDGAWLAGWLDVKAAGTVDPALARAVVTGSPATYLTASDASGVVGVLRAAAVGPWVGLSCLMVAARARRQGLGRALTLAAVRGAAQAGARHAFLQVEAANGAAEALYAGMGFARADTYHYRERDLGRGGP